MTLLNQLQAHRGGLIRIKSELYWCYGRGWDGVPGRICLLLDVATDNDLPADITATTRPGAMASRSGTATVAAALLLVDGTPRWVWVVAEDVELIDEAR